MLRVVPKEPDPKEYPARAYVCDERPYLCYRCRMAACWAGIPAMFRGVTIKNAAEFDSTAKLKEIQR